MGSSLCCRKQNPDTSPQLRRDPFRKNLLPAISIQHPEIYRLTRCRLSDFKFKERLGTGRFGKVYRVVERRTNKILAMKEVRKTTSIHKLEPQLEKEHVILANLKSPWLLEMFQCYETPWRHYLLLQYLPGPNLVQLVKKGTLLPAQVRLYALEMLQAVYSVHSHGYVHRGIKLSNFILDVHRHVKLCGFASCIRFLPVQIAREVFSENYSRGNPPWEDIKTRLDLIEREQKRFRVPHGSCYYCAPEVIRLATCKPSWTSYTYLCDYWSFGVCLYYLMFRKLPFYSDEKIQVPSLIIHWDRTLKFPKSKQTDHLARDLLLGLLQDEHNRLGRNGIYEITAHPYFSKFTWPYAGLVRETTLMVCQHIVKPFALHHINWAIHRRLIPDDASKPTHNPSASERF